MSQTAERSLFTPIDLGGQSLRNRIVMAPMTRGRARNPDLVRRLREDLPLSESMPETYYQGGAEGYIDYPPAPRPLSGGRP
jgi:2,4-dienoyl-CoA reductase-like NADH-dependent reductase (Old Yellow Enzyme family)